VIWRKKKPTLFCRAKGKKILASGDPALAAQAQKRRGKGKSSLSPRREKRHMGLRLSLNNKKKRRCVGHGAGEERIPKGNVTKEEGEGESLSVLRISPRKEKRRPPSVWSLAKRGDRSSSVRRKKSRDPRA